MAADVLQDTLVLSAIRDGHKTLKSIVMHLFGLNWYPGAGSTKARSTDSRLQSLRRRGIIRWRKADREWEIVDA